MSSRPPAPIGFDVGGGCPSCGHASVCPGYDDCPRSRYWIEDRDLRRCSHCGERSSCPGDDSCPSWEARREALADAVDEDELAELELAEWSRLAAELER